MSLPWFTLYDLKAKEETVSLVAFMLDLKCVELSAFWPGPLYVSRRCSLEARGDGSSYDTTSLLALPNAE